MAVNTSFQESSWQNTLSGSKPKLNALFHNGYISDLMINFPGKDKRYKAHKVIFGMASPVFEQMLFGPMATTGAELQLPDENPEAFRIVLAHCYEVNIQLSDIDQALHVYLLADKYFLDDLKKSCLYQIKYMFEEENIVKVFEFSSNFNFLSLKEVCCKYVSTFPHLLMLFSHGLLKELIESSFFTLRKMLHIESWRNPDVALKEDTFLQILKSKICSLGLIKFSGCVSAEIVRNIVLATHEKRNNWLELNLSFRNHQQANEILSLLGDIKFNCCLSIHLQCKVIPADRIGKIPTLFKSDIYLSMVADDGIEWVISVLYSLKPISGPIAGVCLPSSELTLIGF